MDLGLLNNPVPQPPAGTTPAVPPAPAEPPVAMRELTDMRQARRLMFDNLLSAAKTMEPVRNKRHTLRLVNPYYADEKEYQERDRKQALLSGQTLNRRLRGTWELVDNASGDVLDRREMTVAKVPYLFDNGTFVFNGNEYPISYQSRLAPGVYTRRRGDDSLEAHINVAGRGAGHRYVLDAAKGGVFYLNMGQANIPLLTLAKSLGATDDELREAWGDDVLAANQQNDDSRAMGKLLSKLVRNADPNLSMNEKRELLAKSYRELELDEDVTEATLGKRFKRLDKDVLLAATRKLLAINRGEAEPDDRDDLAFQKLVGVEDLFAERLSKDYQNLRRQLLHKASWAGNLKRLTPGALTGQLEAVLTASGLAQAAEEINPLEILDKVTRVTRMGEGGIPSADAIPDESRSVHPSQLGYIDLLRTPESMKAGVDLYLSRAARKGADGRLYAPFEDPKGNIVYKSPRDLSKLTVAISGERSRRTNRILALEKGRVRWRKRSEIDLFMPDDFEQAFSPLGNLIPLKGMSKGQRNAMGSRMLTQALPLVEPEAPFVQNGMGGDQRSYEHEYGKFVGALRAEQPGVVEQVSDEEITVRYQDGSRQRLPLAHNAPYNRKTFLHNTPTVRPGQAFGAGDLLARSNFTDGQGNVALGRNLRVGYVPFGGLNYEDAVVISKSAARRFTSEHMYGQSVDLDEKVKPGKRAYTGAFGSRFGKEQLELIDDDGVVKPGTLVQPGDPLILAVREREHAANKLVRRKSPGLEDKAVTWEHHDPGLVTDVVKGKNGLQVFVKSTAEARVGDKLCYDPLTEVLTRRGWVPVGQLKVGERVASLNPKTGMIEYVPVVAMHEYQHRGRMYGLDTTQVSLLVTDNHNLWAQPRGRKEYGLWQAQQLYGKRYRLQNNGRWEGKEVQEVVLPALQVKAGQSGNGSRELPPLRLPIDTYLMLLGLYVSEGSCFDQPGDYGIEISQVKPHCREIIAQALQAAGVHACPHANGFRIWGKQLMQHFKPLGLSWQKHLPPMVFELPPDKLQLLFDWMLLGDGHRGKSHTVYTTTSQQLAGEVQRLLLHMGYAGNIRYTPPREGEIKGKTYQFRAKYDVIVYRAKNRPTINHGHIKRQNGQQEAWVDYDGPVYCPTLQRNHVLYVRRNGKPVWCGNSGLYGNKGVISAIIDDDQMPQDERGRPLELLLNEHGLISRGNDSQMAAAWLGKVAELTGKPFIIPDGWGEKKILDFVQQQLDAHGLKDTETLTDPATGRKIANIATGNTYFLKLHHTAESKVQGRSTGGYTAEGTPAKGGDAGSKRVSLMDTRALHSHGALGVLQDIKYIRGQDNPEWWLDYLQGNNPTHTKVPLVWEKYVSFLQGAGINVVPTGAGNKQLSLMPLTDQAVEEMVGDRELQSGETVHFDGSLRPVPGGLFDPKLTGGHGGRRWSYVKLAQPLPNPVMEEPIRHLLGLTQKQYRDILAGRQEVGGVTGPEALQKALASLDVDTEIARAREAIKGTRRGERDKAIRRLGHLKDTQRLGIHPKQWLLSKVPVVPPLFRPVSVIQQSGTPLVSDPNYLYKELIEANKLLGELSSQVDDVSEERLAVYDAFKAVAGLGEPTQPALKEKRVKGLLKHVLGSSPKMGMVQRKLLSTPVDTVGRAVITPDPDLDMDSVALPEDKAWEAYRVAVARRLRRKGLPLSQALKLVDERTPEARKELLEEMQRTPVYIARPPVLHRFGVMAFWPRLTKDDVMKVSPLITKGFGADFDGDAMQFHVPIKERARQEAIELMLPSRNLISPSDFKSPMHMPSQEYLAGLFAATEPPARRGPPRRFATWKEAMQAFLRGEITLQDEVEVAQRSA